MCTVYNSVLKGPPTWDIKDITASQDTCTAYLHCKYFFKLNKNFAKYLYLSKEA